MFIIAKFIESNTIEVVPSKWYNDGVCSWPKYKVDRVRRAIEREEDVDSTWDKFDSSIVGGRHFGSYSLARQHLKQAELNSDLSDCDKLPTPKSTRTHRRSRKKGRYEGTDCEEDDSEPSYTLNVVNPPEPPLQFDIPLEAEDEIGANGKVLDNTTPEEDIIIDNETGDNFQNLPQSHQINGFEAFIIEKLTALDFSLKQLHCKVDKLLNAQKTARKGLGDALNLPLPCLSKEDLISLNTIVTSNPKKRSILIEALRLAGGSSCAEAVRIAINKLMTKEVGVLYSSVGGKGKEKFFDLEFRQIIFDALKERPELTDVTEKLVKDTITSYLPKFRDKIVYEQQRKSK